MDRLRDRVILITGSTGIAAATAVRCGAEGASVSSSRGRRTTPKPWRPASRETGGRVAWAAADLTSESRDGRGGRRPPSQRFGRIDGFFSVAGGSGRRFGDGRIHTVTAEAWEATAALNLHDPGPGLRPRRPRRCGTSRPNDGGTRGSILLMGSVTTVAPVPELFGTHAYAAAKGALDRAHDDDGRDVCRRPDPGEPRRAVAHRHADGERAATDPHILEFARRKQPLAGEMLDPDEVAQAAIYFLSDESRAVTGQSLAVDGGWSLISTTADPPA